VYVFDRIDGTWVEQQKLQADDGDAFDEFGEDVSVDGDVLVAGANLDTTGGFEGTAYVFRLVNGTWTQEQKLVPTGGGLGFGFGKEAVIDGDLALLGVDSDDELGPGAGAVFVFAFDGTEWTQTQKLLAPDGAAGDGFGNSIDGDRALAAADREDSLGAVYVLARDPGDTTWSVVDRFVGSGVPGGDQFGDDVALDGSTAATTAPGHDEAGTNAGVAYVHRISPCAADLDCDGAIAATDLLMLLAAWGPCGEG